MTQTRLNHVLTLNGKRYDALSGRLLDGRHTSSQPKSVDGFALPAHHSGRPAHGMEPPRFTAPVITPQKVFDVTRSGTHHARRHQLQHSKTLMRQAVHHPAASLKRRTKAVPYTGTLIKPPQFDVIMPKYSVNSLDHERWKRAKTIARNRLIRRFADVHPSIRQAVAKPAPVSTPIQTPRPLIPQPSTDIFERALAAANSHKQPYAPVKKKKHHRLRAFTGVLASSMAILLIVAFVAYQNANFIQLRIASSRSGINATLPAWQPSGFRVGTFAYGPGNVTVTYTNPVSGGSYTIAQAASSWDSATLLSDYVYPHNETYDTLTSGGNTIYTYGNNDATWVSGGIWYKLTSSGNLSNSQIVNIATSMQS